MMREFERRGVPSVEITALPTIASEMGVNRIVGGVGIPHPLGDPARPKTEERELRRQLVGAALRALATPVTGPTVFQP
jgi:glycine reductase